MIRFSEPYVTGRELEFVEDVLTSGRTSGNGKYTQLCHEFFKQKYGYDKCLLTSSCTDALEMAAILCQIKPGDEVIIPSYTFVSSANPFIMRGAKLVFCDSMEDNPNLSIEDLERRITDKTKAVVWVHYAGSLMNIRSIQKLCKEKSIFLIEDAAQALDTKNPDGYAGKFGDIACFSFHATKNISCGEGGLLVVNNEELKNRAEIIWEKGTNRAAFYRGEIDKYGWVDVGSSYLPSEITASVLYAQLLSLDEIMSKRMAVWNTYYDKLSDLQSELLSDQHIDFGKFHNGHIYYLLAKDITTRDSIIKHLASREINAVFHYQCLHMSRFYLNKNRAERLKNAEKYHNCLLRLPLHSNMTIDDANFVIEQLMDFCS